MRLLSASPPITGPIDSHNDLLIAAQRGDEQAFDRLVTPYRRELHLHAYRMLGSLDDADDAMQESLLRAWRHIGTYRPTGPFRAWLYRIATNVCLTTLGKRSRQQEVPVALVAAQEKERDAVLLDPYPDHLLDQWRTSVAGPEAETVRRESVELAFIAAVQFLPPRQRAILLLRDVVGYAASEAAELLGMSVAGANSALQRARTTLREHREAATITREHRSPGDVAEQRVVQRLVTAWHAADIDALVGMLADDALLTMPPIPARFVGRNTIGRFLATVPGDGHLERFRLVPIRANRQPALATYLRERDSGPLTAHAIIVLALDGEAICSIVRLGDGHLFPRFGLPLTVTA